MVNVDDSVGERRAKVIGHNLHVPRQDYQVNLKILKQLDLLGLLLSLCILSYLEDFVTDPKHGGYGSQVRVVRDDANDVAGN